MSEVIYYVWVTPTGIIGCAESKKTIPDGAALLFKTRAETTVNRLFVTGRHGLVGDRVELLVPGVPEAETIIEATECVVKFLRLSFPRMLKDIARWEGYVKDMKEGEDCKQEGEGG